MNSTLPRLKGHFSFQKRTDSLSIAFKWSKCNSTICLHYFFTFCLLSLLCSLKSNPPKEVYILEADFVQPLKSLLFSWTSQPQAVKSSSFCFLRYWHKKENNITVISLIEAAVLIEALLDSSRRQRHKIMDILIYILLCLKHFQSLVKTLIQTRPS